MLKDLSPILLLILLLSCNDNDTSNEETSDNGITLPVNNLPAPQPIMFTVDAIYPHDPEAFTQGLAFNNGKLYEGTGEFETSTLRVVDIKTGIAEKKFLISDPKIFGEGITIFKNKIYQLTWQNHKIFVYKLNDITKPVQTLTWKPDGWGITNDGKNLIISDGSDKLYYVQPNDSSQEMKIMKIISVADNRGTVDSLNELEYINGFVYANRWYNNHIAKIDTGNGHVAGYIDMTGLLQQYAPKEAVSEGSVLNGIAYDSTTKKLYITGKRWPKLFEIHLN